MGNCASREVMPPLPKWGPRVALQLQRLDRAVGELYRERMDLHFCGELWYWRGPAPFHFVTVPDEESAEIASFASLITYGWGMIPVAFRIGDTETTTSLWPKNGGYIVPVKKLVRQAEVLDVGDQVDVFLGLQLHSR